MRPISHHIRVNFGSSDQGTGARLQGGRQHLRCAIWQASVYQLDIEA